MGTVVYDDAGRFQPEEALVSHRYGLAGKPDYIVRGEHASIPVEVKSRICRARGPHDSEKAQLFAYCLLVEEMSGQPIPYGLIEYPNRQWRVPFGEAERRYVFGLLGEIRQAQAAADVPRDHLDTFRCRSCGFRGDEVCGQALR